MNRFDTTTRSYQIALESFSTMAMDQSARDKLSYRRAAMEAVTSPDSGMVLDRLYKNVMGRASINFGKIPESAGDLTKFTKYKTIADTLSLLDRQMAEYKIKELQLAHELHDDLIKCREDFAYGFKVDSQFLKTTYNTMVYSLCEILNLCDVIYIDMLKAGAEGRHFDYKPYDELLLVQNVEKFVGMIRSGEWSSMMLTIRKDAKNLINVVYNDSGDGLAHTLGGIVGTVGIPGAVFVAAKPAATKLAEASGEALGMKHFASAIKTGTTNAFKSTWSRWYGKIGIVILAIISVLLLVRTLVFIFYRGAYKLNDVLDDQEKMLKAHIDNYADPSGTSKSLEKQKHMYETLAGLQDNIRTHILKSDAEGRKMLRESNSKDFTIAAFQKDMAEAASTSGDDDFAIS